MSAAATPSPAAVRTPSHRQQAFGSPADRPVHRSQSTTTRPSGAAPASPHRSLSHSQAHGRPASAHQRENLAHIGRRDFEQSSAARPPSSRRSMSRDRTNVPPTPTRAESARAGQRSSSRHPPDPATPQAINGVATDNASRSIAGSGSTANARRRTMITSATGQWALGKTIGAGSMGKVKLARNMETGEQVAVKIVPRQSTDEHRSAADRERADHSKEIRTAREAAIVSLVNHPFICSMRDVVRTNYHWYMLFEYVNGGQMLDYIISHGRLKEKQARKFARQIASALDYCHRNSIVHRDLKIENILISKTSDIKIIDFGLSNLFYPRNHLETFCGSLYFAAPELLQAKHYTGPEVDVWSFGIVLYVLVCGKVPFDDQSMPQLHAKIKKGHVEYPPWLTAECKNIISRMLVTDPKQRAGMAEIMNHPWMMKGFNSPPENYLPSREPLELPLDRDVLEKMHGFDFGSVERIEMKLSTVIESEEYRSAVRAASQKTQAQTPDLGERRGVFNFYKRRNSTTSSHTLISPSVEAVQHGSDPVNAFHPLISVYYLVREKLERERQEANSGAHGVPKTAGDKPFKMPDLPAPEAAYTNSATYEMRGEQPTGGRSRPRARTHGEDEAAEGLQKMNLNAAPPPTSPAIIAPPAEQPPVKKESTAVGLLRRLSTRGRRGRDHDRDRSSHGPPSVSVSGPENILGAPRKSFSVRRTREKDMAPPTPLLSVGTPQQPELLTPPTATETVARKLRGLGRSTSVNSADLRRRMGRKGNATDGNVTEPPPTSGSDRSSITPKPGGDAASDDMPTAGRLRVAASRAKSLGHARRESIQARRARREQARESNVPEEAAHEIEGAEAAESRSPDTMKPVYLKGLFSVSTTSNKPLAVIRSDIIRVLKQLGVEYGEIKGGFSCQHVPSIDLNKVVDPPHSPGHSSGAGHRRKISFGGFIGSDKDKERDEFRLRHRDRSPHTPRSYRHRHPDRSFTNSESDDSIQREPSRMEKPRAPGETTTHVQSDLGGSMILRFEIFIVKVPLFSLHGIQFKKVDGGTWQYKNMAQQILDQLRL